MAKPFEGKSVLLVDDDPDIISALQTIFVDMGATVTTANDGNIAIDKANSEHPDLVVLDAMLPGRSGFLVLEKLKSSAVKQEHKRPGVIMITGNQGKRHQVYAESMGVDAYINKPFRMERLIESAEALLSVKS